ncbi:hypothetical protein OP10G_1880 [Fimbriimonas ginsengisoli Gsoil 348]|uniref:Uncharacterized protein n=2 Tax=Fimbriimonas ginsengisoli TaxID=1005039 RepID=A0A068NNV3_FIMGI|nr:hypothetical protein OP10G_1880 [Fimbriimonas ginsengisoli Gsoil 348]
MWAMIAHDPPELPLTGMQVVDDKGRRWPSALNVGVGAFTVLIPEGYSESPKALYAVLDTGGRDLIRVRLPNPPPPVHEAPPNFGKPWPGLRAELHEVPVQRDRLEVLVASPLPEGHVLMVKEIGSSSTLHENVVEESSFLFALGRRPIRQPIRLHYPETTREIYLRVRELAPEKRHAHVRIPGLRPRFQYGEWWLADLSKRIQLPDGTHMLVSAADRRLYRPPRHRRKEVRIFVVPSGTATVDRATLISPTHLGGTPVMFWNASGSTHGKRVDFKGGLTDIEFDVDYSAYKTVRQATLAVPTLDVMPPLADVLPSMYRRG